MEREQLNYLLQLAPSHELTALCEQVTAVAEVTLIQKPTFQTLLLPVQDPINTGRFYGGEVLVTSAVVQVNSSHGWAMVMDDNAELARKIAMLDAAYGAGVCLGEIGELARLCEKQQQVREARTNSRVESTRVSFDLL